MTAIDQCIEECEEIRGAKDTPGAPKRQNPWAVVRPECKTCFEDMWPKGDWERQSLEAHGLPVDPTGDVGITEAPSAGDSGLLDDVLDEIIDKK